MSFPPRVIVFCFFVYIIIFVENSVKLPFIFYEGLKANFILSDESLNSLFLISEGKKSMIILMILFNILLEILASAMSQVERHLEWEKKGMIVYVENLMKFTKKNIRIKK